MGEADMRIAQLAVLALVGDVEDPFQLSLVHSFRPNVENRTALMLPQHPKMRQTVDVSDCFGCYPIVGTVCDLGLPKSLHECPACLRWAGKGPNARRRTERINRTIR